MRRISLTIVLAAVALAALPTGANAATTLGETFDPDGCAEDTTYIQTADPGNRYAVPFDGVITKWSYHADPVDPVTEVRLKVASIPPGADLTQDTNVTIVGQSAIEIPAGGVVNTYLTQVPVKAGYRIGEWVNGGDGGCSRGDPAYIDHFFGGGDVQPGTTDLFSQEDFQQDISAVVEADCDKDGLGDETQDTNTASCLPPCGGRTPTIGGTSANDRIAGTPARDVISTLAGNDTVSGGGGNDIICGGPGKDKLKGGPGRDRLLGQAGRDAVAGGGGNDTCKGGRGRDTEKSC